MLRIPGIGGKTYLSLLDKVGSPTAVFKESRSTLTSLGLKSSTVDAILKPDWDRVNKDLSWLEEPGRHLLAITEETYPPLLREIPDPPPVLFVNGSMEMLHLPQIAIVGSRNPSKLGLTTAYDFASALARSGIATTSGLALGIDAAAHQGALNADFTTIAVTGTGLDRVYPARHHELACNISSNGALVSEFPPGTVAKANHFPRRNRIISGLSLGTLVVEAAIKSGSLITARLALEQGREVFAIPGSIHNPLSRGCNALIRQGAKLVETAEDIFEELGQFQNANILDSQQSTTLQSQFKLDADHANLLKNIAQEPTSVDTLIAETGLPPESVASMLLILELEGYISSAAGGCYYRLS